MITSTTSEAPASANSDVKQQQSQSHSNWWSSYESWIEKHWLFLTYIGAGVAFVVLVMVILLIWRKKVNKRRELIQKLTVHPVKPQKSNSNIQSETVITTNAQPLENGNVLPTTETIQPPQESEHQVAIDIEENRSPIATAEDAGVEKNKERNVRETKREVRFAPSVNERTQNQNSIPTSSIVSAMKRMHQSESNFSEIYNQVEDTRSHNDAMATIYETLPMREMTPSVPQAQGKRDTVFTNNTEVRESRRDPEFSAIYEPDTQPNDAGYLQADVPVADEVLPSENKRHVHQSDRIRLDKIQNFTATLENQGGKSRLSRKHDLI